MSATSTDINELATKVEAILTKAAAGRDRPADTDLGPVSNFLLQNDDNAPSSSTTHWYCDNAKSSLHKRSASYLIFLFAFRREGTAKAWVEALEGVLRNCKNCARGFGVARREFGETYMAHYPPASQVNFFAAVDRWQTDFILGELNDASQPPYDASISAAPTLETLPAAITQLLLSTPSLLDSPQITRVLDATISLSPTTPLSNIAPLGLNPVIVRLLSSPESHRRTWAMAQISGRRFLTFEQFVRTGVRDELERLYNQTADDISSEKWQGIHRILQSSSLARDAVTKGLLENLDLTGKKRNAKAILSVLTPALGTESPAFPYILYTFAELLLIDHERAFWSFDKSPELPHTLFADIKNNTSFRILLEAHFTRGSFFEVDSEQSGGEPREKGKARAGSSNPVSWIPDFLHSLIDKKHTDTDIYTRRTVDTTGFSEALAKVSVTCFQDFQLDRWNQAVRAAIATAGLDGLALLQKLLSRDEGFHRVAMSSAFDIHSTFITTVAFRPAEYPLPIWANARHSARALLTEVFDSDAKDILESILGLSAIATEERKRQLKARKAKLKGESSSPAIPVTKLHRAAVHKGLWNMAYNALAPSDVAGAALLIRSIAISAHMEKLNRDETWSFKELKLQEVLKEEDFVDAVRAVNSGIQVTRDPFAHAMEAFAVQATPAIVKELWSQPDIPRSAISLLLAPAEDVHDPTISLIQQSFDNVDDRGDCFRVLLREFPAQAMDGLAHFLTRFIETANITPESCSLAKWLVRCFTDVLDALCQPTEESEPLLQSSSFLSTFSEGIPMSRRVTDLWHLMTTSLAVIFKRTTEWAPLYDNETMVDWMRDALIFGRQMVEHIRAFEAAALGVSGGSSRFTENGESPAKPTRAGAKLVQKLEIVLHDLVSWLRLTDLETLHQTFELIKTIVGRIAKVTPDVAKTTQLERTLLEIDKFSRKASKSYRTKLSDDLLSELSDLLEPFNLEIGDDDEVLFIRNGASAVQSTAATLGPSTSTSAPVPAPKVKNAFEEMMRKSSGSPAPASASTSRVRPTTSAVPKHKVIAVEDFEDDDFLSHFSAKELDKIEKGAKVGTTPASVPTAPKPRPSTYAPTTHSSARPSSSVPSSSKLSINVVPKPAPHRPSAGSNFKSQVMRDLRVQHRHEAAERQRNIGGLSARVPAGSGVGAYQGPKRVIKPVESSGSSASESSEGENGGIGVLVARQKSPKKVKPIMMPMERRPIKVLGTPMSDIIKQREDRKAAQHALKQRLRPDLSSLYRYVLAWDPQHTGVLAPHTSKFATEIGNLGPVPTTFPSAARYRKVMLPLFLQELWAQCLKDNRVGMPIWVEVSTRTYEDDFLDIEMTVQGNTPHDFFVNETDVVILRQNSPTAKPVLAKVQGFKRKFKDVALKVRILGQNDQKELAGRSKWQLQKHVSLSTALREYGALQGLPYYEAQLLDNVLAAKSAKIPRISDEDVEDAKSAFDTNEPQARAIIGAMSVEGFALIQGPPGTGKTKTISGLVGKFISHRDGIIHNPGAAPPPKAKLLVCAPSNAAIDEVCKRLMNGVPSSSGRRLHPTIVRIGIDSSVNIAVKDVSLDSLVEARVSSESTNKGGGDYSRIQSELEEVKRQINAKQDEMQKAHNHDEQRQKLENEYHTLIQKRTQLGQKSSKAKDAARDATRHLEGARRAARAAILKEADIICATLSGAGHESLAPFTFETVIIDEAAQAIEMSCLIPLKYGCKRCIMVGDPNQLPPTTFSSEAEKFHYNESLFVRIAKHSPANVQLLSIQYRMNPFISELPSKVFYDGQLKDGPGMAAKTTAIWHQRPLFGPYRFFNVEGIESKAGTSTKNVQEALVAVELYRRLEADFDTKVDFAFRIGVISMYKEQLWELKRKFTEAFGASILEKIEFNTVDGFQGQEKDIIILSCVRSGPGLRSIGFLKDPRRMNVALTRAKSSLFVIGNAPTLERTDDRWKIIVGDARERGFLINYDSTTFAPPKEDIPKAKIKSDPKSSSSISQKTPGKNVEPPKSIKDEAVPLKRKSSIEVKEGEKKKKRKKEKKNSTDKQAIRSTSPMSIASSSDTSSVRVIAPPSNRPPTPATNSVPSDPRNVYPPPPPPASLPPAIPPPPSTSMPPPALKRGPPPGPPRPPEDVLFIKKKKKKLPGANPAGSAPPAGGSLPNARALINERLNGRR